MANRRIKKVRVFIQKYLGQKTDNPGAFAPKLLDEFRSLKMAQEAIETFGSMSHQFGQILMEQDGKTDLDEYPCLTRCEFGDKHTKWGYEFELWENGIFHTPDEKRVKEFRMYYEVEYYENCGQN